MTTVDDILAHHGIKGMKWGVRKDRSSGESSSDATRAKANATKAKTSGTHTLSNDDLQHLVTRMNLEKQYSSLKPATTSDKAAKFISDVLGNVAKQQVTAIATKAVTQQVAKKLK